MSGSNQYVLDANVFIEAKNKYYSFNLCPGFWKALIAEHERKCVSSIDRVRNELVKKSNKPDPDKPADEPDPLSDWAKDTVPDTFFKKTEDQAVIEAFQEMMTWVNSEPQFVPAARTEFATVADGWLVAHAKVNGLIVVTHEEYRPEAKRRVPIPNICLEFDVDYANTFKMLEDLKVKFVLRTKR